jgi:putative acetyltransferase
MQSVIRPAVIADEHTLALIWRFAWASANPDAPYIEPLAHWLSRVRAEFWTSCQTSVAVFDSQSVAFYVLRSEPRVLEQLFVLPSFQSSGVGSLLLNHIKHTCPKGFSLYVSASNVRAQRFYARHGLHPGATSVNPLSRRARVQYTYSPTTPSNAA